MRTILRSAAFGAMLAGLLAPAVGIAQSLDTPVGLWKSIDDETKKPKALIRIVEQGGQLVGRIEKILTDKPDALCEACTDERKGKPVQGMTILTGLKKDGEEWTGGEILDPNNGKVYKAKAKLADGGRKLDLRGFIGIALVGRTQTWLREQ
ncbi:MAG: DUF2147 domain-containing protein [Burkholderiaceae bacterium]|jgi:uncharacterized protein (DUF2147 family)|nr:DUF2147 domain-containing protein [Burkholderiales bacterium]MCZ8098809.1 DUF2147 domain-containing protein [Burkholderiales bacterium]MCZ8336851.1 DUF2147 domain-containing protein [Burkholderiaceae bacterium]